MLFLVLDGMIWKETNEKLRRYHRLGSPEEIEGALDRAEEIMERYLKLGNIEDIELAITKALNLLEKHPEFLAPTQGEVPETKEFLGINIVEEINMRKLRFD